MVCIGLWFIIAFFTNRWDKEDQIKWRLRSLIDNRRADKQLYQGMDMKNLIATYFTLRYLR